MSATAGGTFSIDWLALREPADLAARERAARALGLRRWAARRRSDASALQVVDLACGTGANLRSLAPLLGGTQRWRVLDQDDALLSAWPSRLRAWAESSGAEVRDGLGDDYGEIVVAGRGFVAHVHRVRADLSVAGLPGVEIVPGALVTASALLDLVSEPWLRTLAGRCMAARAAALLAMTVDGRIEWSPDDPWDAEAAARFAAHQRRDKGFGPALGPRAAERAARVFQAAGMRVRRARSDWLLGPGGLQSATLASIVEAVTTQDPACATAASAWSARRSAPGAPSRLRVGHIDLLALPA